MIAARREDPAPVRHSRQSLGIHRAPFMLWGARCGPALTPVVDVMINPVKFPQMLGRLLVRLARVGRYRRGGTQTRPIWLFVVCFVCMKAAAASLYSADAAIGVVLVSTLTLAATAAAQVIGR